MARGSKWTAPKADSSAALEPRATALTLSPAELEALLERLCSCGALLVTRAALRLGAAPQRSARRCARRARNEWCRAGERATVAGNRAETKFG